MYYYNDGENEVGPFSLERLNALRHRGLIGSGTLVRGAGDASWTPFADVAAADAAPDAASARPAAMADAAPAGIHPPLRASRTVEGDAAQPAGPWGASRAAARQDPLPTPHPSGWLAQPPTPWRRYAARILDTTLNGIIGFSLVGIIFYSVAPASADRFFSALRIPRRGHPRPHPERARRVAHRGEPDRRVRLHPRKAHLRRQGEPAGRREARAHRRRDPGPFRPRERARTVRPDRRPLHGAVLVQHPDEARRHQLGRGAIPRPAPAEGSGAVHPQCRGHTPHSPCRRLSPGRSPRSDQVGPLR